MNTLQKIGTVFVHIGKIFIGLFILVILIIFVYVIVGDIDTPDTPSTTVTPDTPSTTVEPSQAPEKGAEMACREKIRATNKPYDLDFSIWNTMRGVSQGVTIIKSTVSLTGMTFMYHCEVKDGVVTKLDFWPK